MTKYAPGEPVVIKKYANRRLYDTRASTYVTLDDLCRMVKKGEEFQVVDAKTGEDLTRVILTQIIFEQESKGYNLLPVSFLKRTISFYDDSLRSIVPHYLEASMDHFFNHQHRWRETMNQFQQFSPLKQFEEISKQNFDLFNSAIDMFSQFSKAMVPAAGQEDEKKK